MGGSRDLYLHRLIYFDVACEGSVGIASQSPYRVHADGRIYMQRKGSLDRGSKEAFFSYCAEKTL